MPSPSPSPSNETAPLLPQHNPPYSALYKFNLAIGLPLPTPSQPFILSYPVLRAQSRGLYSTILTLHHDYSLHYHLFIGAVLALASPSKVYVTALGVTNSVLVGVLGILKSQGLVEKAAGNEFEMRKVRDWVEECEGRLVMEAGGDEEEDVQGLVGEAWDRYERAVEVVERNRLGRFGGVGKRGGVGMSGAEEEGKNGRREGAGSRIVGRSDPDVAEDRRMRRK
ncbi:hypothetical protein ACMFMG_009650 [Clarireedia jacksonii]